MTAPPASSGGASDAVEGRETADTVLKASRMPYTVGVVCDLGAGPERGGRQRNEDNFLVCCENRVLFDAGGVRKPQAQPGEGLLLAVCDGMGGHADGHVASMTAVKVLARLYQPNTPSKPDRVLLRYVLETHRQLHEAALSEGGAAPEPAANPTLMGTTLTAVWIHGRTAAWVHVGDSRLYHYRRGQLTRISADHTRNEFARREGRPERPDGDALVQNFIYGSRGLGDNSSLRLDPGLDNGLLDLLPGDRLVLCTDGLTGTLADVHLAGILRDFEEPATASDELRALAIEAGSLDNVTVIVARVDADPPTVVPGRRAALSDGRTMVPPDASEWEDDEETETDLKDDPTRPPPRRNPP